MEEIQVGEYVRTKDGIISKVTDILKGYCIDCDNDVFDIGNGTMMEIPWEYIEEYVIKHSKNIIDLIEKDDYINGEKVIDIFNPEFLSLGELPYVRTQNNKYEEQDIKTILTKEQMENNCYRIEE